MIEIKRWDNGEVIYTADVETVKEALEKAVSEEVSLYRAKLNYAELNGAKLNYAELNGAKLNYAELNGAKLNYAELNCAELNYAELNCAELNCAELNYAIVFGNFGNSHRPTYYNVVSDEVFCGCFRGNLEKFTEAVIEKYGYLEETNYKFFIDECKWAVEKFNIK